MKRFLVFTMALLGLMVIGAQGAAAQVTHWVNDDDPNGGGYASPGTSCSDPGYPTVQAAINAATSGDTIQVCAGTYVENVNLAKSLTLLGAQAGVDARGRVATESTITAAAGTLLTLLTGSAGSTIDGFTFLGGSRAIESQSGPIDGLQLLNNRIQGFTGNGVFLNDNGINITVDQNDIDGSSKVGGGGLFHLDQDNFDGFHFTNNRVVNGITGTGFFVDGNRNVDKSTAGARTPLFSGNFIDNNQTGVNLGRKAWGDGPITANTFSNNLFDGLQGGPKDSLITQNDFDSNGRSGLALTGFGGTTDPTRGAQGNTVAQNCFTGNGFLQGGEGIFFSASQFAGTISTNVANQNNIFGNAVGARYLGSETIDAEFNWWGSSTGPTHPSNPGGTGDAVVDDGDGIDFVPFLTSPAGGTPCIPTPPPSGKVTGGGQIDVPDGRASFGFNAKQDGGVASGHLNYLNHATGAKLNCKVTVVMQLTTTTAKFFGTCSSDSTASSFTAEVEDNAEPGRNMDKFTITYGSNTEGSPLRSGNIQIH
ncbi:MAG: right-handed parallel beta-helix repeat-containing protein [Deltaproteobacteria bacterium]|nr:right-handed parallel beta-helix repeat-containing protein [Deltaproteobacteria bacterium]